MKRKYLTLVTGIVLSFSLLSFPVYAMDEPVQPTVPSVQTEETVADYNAQVDTYNAQVDVYNQQVDNDYNQQVTEQQKIVEYNQKEQERVDNLNAAEEEKVAAHNAEEDQKVEQNQQDLAQYEQDLEQYEKEYAQYENDLKNEQTVMTYYGAESVEDYNMKVFETPDEEEYKEVLEQAVDRRVVREETAKLKDKKLSSSIESVADTTQSAITYTVTVIHTFFDKNYNVLKTEKQEKEVNMNDLVTIKSLANGNEGTKTVIDSDKYAVFYHYINDNYLSYYWYETFAYMENSPLKVASDFVHETEGTAGDWYQITYKNGLKYYEEAPYLCVEYYYTPYLTINKPIEPKVPEEVVECTPDYWTVKYQEPKLKKNIIPVKGKYLNKINYLTYTPKEEKEPRKPVTPPQEPDTVTPAPAPAPFVPRYYTPMYYNYPVLNPTYTIDDDGLMEIEDDEVPLASPADTADNNVETIQRLILTIIGASCIFIMLLYYKKRKAEL